VQAFASLALDKFYRSLLSTDVDEQKRDDTIVEAPMSLEVAVLDELNGVQKVLLDKRKALSPTVYLDAGNTYREDGPPWR
jgi:hypothetical protein